MHKIIGFLLALCVCVSALAPRAAFSTSPHSSSAPSAELSAQIVALELFYQKKLIGLSSLVEVLPAAWLTDNFDAAKEAARIEEELKRLLLLQKNTKSNENDAARKAELHLLQLKLQWVSYSPVMRKQLIGEAVAKELAQRSKVQSEAEIANAATAVQQVDEKKQEIHAEIDASRSAREKQLLEWQLMMQNDIGWLAKQRLALGLAKKIFSTDVEQWREAAAGLNGSIENESELGIQQLNRARSLLRKLIVVSNERIWSEDNFLFHYFNTASFVPPEMFSESLQIREMDSDKARAILLDIQEKALLLEAERKSFISERERLLADILAWNYQQRQELLDIRGVFVARAISESAYLFGNTEPVILELKTLAAGVRFYFWSAKYEWGNDLTHNVFVISRLLHIINLLALFALTALLLVRREKYISSIGKRIRRFFSGGKLYRTASTAFEFFKYFYVFIVLVVMGKLAIDFIASLGFDHIHDFDPLYNHIILFFLFFGLVNYFTPLLSQREYGTADEKANAIELTLCLMPKIFLYYWLAAGLIELFLMQVLRASFLQLYVLGIFKLLAALFAYVTIKRHIEQWRIVSASANLFASWERLIEKSIDRWWEPLVLLISGGLGVYRVIWSILSTRLSELDMARSFQAMLSRAILERQKKRSSHYLNNADAPPGYWDAFDFFKNVDPVSYVDRALQTQQLQKIYEEWKSTQVAARVLITGDRGIGKTELVKNFLRASGASHTVLSLRSSMFNVTAIERYLNETLLNDHRITNRQELFVALNQLPSSVLVIENLENAMLRKIGGFDAISLLIDLVLFTSNKHLWIVTCNSYAWTIAKQGVRGIECFTDAIYLEGMAEEHIKELILSRHKHVADEHIDFSQLQMGAKNTKNTDVEASNQKAKELYFRILWNYTRGNPRYGIYYWRESLNWRLGKTHVHLFDVPEQKILEHLQDSTLMLLAALIEHNGLTLKGVSEIMNTTEVVACRRIEELSPYSMVFLVDDHGDESWHVESFWFSAVESYLVKRQFLFRGDKQ